VIGARFWMKGTEGLRRAVAVSLVVAGLVVASAPGWPPADAATPPPTAKERESSTDERPAIPVAEVAGRADEVGAFLRSLDEQLLASPQIKRIEFHEVTRDAVIVASGMATCESCSEAAVSRQLTGI